jgi:hypothetical protein
MKKTMFAACGAAALALVIAADPAATGQPGQGLDDNRGLRATVQTLEDTEAIRALPACYGYGHDLIYRHLNGDHSDAIEALRRCFYDDVATSVFLFDENTPSTHLQGIDGIIRFVEGFALDTGYSSARNVPGNVQIEFTGPSSARVLSSTVAPHFLTNGPSSPAADFIEARYVQNAVKRADGAWRTVSFDLVVQQIWRGVGAYPSF